jgi:hypothetical protein
MIIAGKYLNDHLFFIWNHCLVLSNPVYCYFLRLKKDAFSFHSIDTKFTIFSLAEAKHYALVCDSKCMKSTTWYLSNLIFFYFFHNHRFFLFRIEAMSESTILPVAPRIQTVMICHTSWVSISAWYLNNFTSENSLNHLWCKLFVFIIMPQSATLASTPRINLLIFSDAHWMIFAARDRYDVLPNTILIYY